MGMNHVARHWASWLQHNHGLQCLPVLVSKKTFQGRSMEGCALWILLWGSGRCVVFLSQSVGPAHPGLLPPGGDWLSLWSLVLTQVPGFGPGICSLWAQVVSAMASPSYTVPEAQGAGLEHSFLLLCLEELRYKTQVAQSVPSPMGTSKHCPEMYAVNVMVLS